jgi:acyl-CoA thioester hydrolase
MTPDMTSDMASRGRANEPTPAAPADRPRQLSRGDFSHFRSFTTRLRDNDMYGHMNNVVYNEYFDTAVNQTLIELGVLDMNASKIIGLVVQTSTSYFSAVGFPDRLTVGMRVARLGRTSISYQLALFQEEDAMAAAQCDFTHAYVERANNKPVELPTELRAALGSYVAKT